MVDDRDKHPRKAAPPGVRAQTAGESWDEDKTKPGEESLRNPPSGEDVVTALRKRVRRASRAAEASVKVATMARGDIARVEGTVAGLATRVENSSTAINIRVGQLERRFDASMGDLGTRITDLDARVDGIGDKLAERLISVLQQERETTLAIHVKEVDAKLEERKADGELRRWSTKKVVATTATIVVAIASAVIAAIHC